jgi:hypothetical protein
LIKGIQGKGHLEGVPDIINQDTVISDTKTKCSIFNDYFSKLSTLDDSHEGIVAFTLWTNSIS